MTTIAIVRLVFIIAGMLGAGGFILYLKNRLKKGDKAIKDNKVHVKNKEKSKKSELKKNKAREKHNEKVNDIIANPNDNSLSNGSRKHSHGFRESCGKDCPAYTGE